MSDNPTRVDEAAPPGPTRNGHQNGEARAAPEVVDRLLTQTFDAVHRQRRFPEATYRLQFHAGFTFRDAAAITPYFEALGISHCYASPYLQARPGSTHGYDISNHGVLNPEIGTQEEYDAWAAGLQQAGLGQVLDTVPNHMGVAGNGNVWWNDILENGPASPYARYFDIAWFASLRPELYGRLLLPILGEPYGKVLEAGQFKLQFDAGIFTLHYYEQRLPVAPRSYALVLGHCLDAVTQALGADSMPAIEYQSILTAIRNLPEMTETELERVIERQREKEVVKRRLARLCEEAPPVLAAIQDAVTRFNGTPGDPASYDLLDALLNRQAYRLAFWRVASDEINYRRFFDINELAALSMEREEVFDATHALVLKLVADGKVAGLRVDHPDGLYDPAQYLWRLQEKYVLALARRRFEAAPEFADADWDALQPELRRAVADRLRRLAGPAADWPLYVVVEKILGVDEALPAGWPTQGTSGYDFLNRINGLFVDPYNEGMFNRIYEYWVDDDTPFAQLVYQKKVLIMGIALSSELNMLAHQLDRLAQRDRWSRDFTLHGLRTALRAVIACFPVYRSYISDEGLSEDDRRYIARAIHDAKARNRALSPALFDFIHDTLLLKEPRPGVADDNYRAEQRRFAGKFQQVTAPVMAKGLEDTAFYIYNRLISLNEVGGDPDRFGTAPPALHRYLQDRQRHWPWALSASSTHDTKRSEDVRARINVLSELPEDWLQAQGRWSQLNEPHRVTIEEGVVAPDHNEETLLYQTLLGAWPLAPLADEERPGFVQRIQAYMQKALHEAKVHTSWINPNPAYDAAINEFVARVLDPQAAAAFLADFQAFQRRVSHYGLFNSLAQTLLKLAAPGVPDVYQGTELWDFSLVDPDNRRPVDYAERQRLLTDLAARIDAGPDLRPFAQELVQARADGRIKLYLITRTLRFRRDHPGLLSRGEYVPISAVGPQKDHVFAFLRHHEGQRVLVAVPRLLTKLVDENGVPLGPAVWHDTILAIPDELKALTWTNLYTGARLQPEDGPNGLGLLAADVFADFPVALLVG